MPSRSTAGFALMAAALLSACQPRLNWREVRPPDADVVALFPCKPDFDHRAAAAGQGAMGLAQCEAGGLRFSLSWADAPDAAHVDAALQAMPQSLAAKLKQPLPRGGALQVPGMTPSPQAAQYRFPATGTAARVAVFAHGTRVYQSLMTGAKDDAAAWDAFVSSLRVGPAVAQPAR